MNINKNSFFICERKNINRVVFFGIISSSIYFITLIYAKFSSDLNTLDPLFQNPFCQFKCPMYGLLNNLQIFIWISCFFINFLLIVKSKKDKISKSIYKSINFLYLGVTFSLFITISDFYNLNNYFAEINNMILIFCSIFLFLTILKNQFMKNIVYLIFFSFIFLALSLIIDIFQDINFFNLSYNFKALIEELFEFIGVTYYGLFWASTLKKFYMRGFF